MRSLPWHPGDRAVTADGWQAVVLHVDANGAPAHFIAVGGRHDGTWRADAVPSFDHVGTAASWLRSCAEAVSEPPTGVLLVRQWNAVRDAIHTAGSMLVWHPDPDLVGRAVAAVGAYLALETKP